MNVVSDHFDPHLKSVPKEIVVFAEGQENHSRRIQPKVKAQRMPVRGGTFNLATDFGPRNRDCWEGMDITIPAAKLYVDRQRNSIATEFFEG